MTQLNHNDNYCEDCESTYPCRCCEWCEMAPCECIDDETEEPYNAEERLLEKLMAHVWAQGDQNHDSDYILKLSR